MKTSTIRKALESLNWQGHVELPDYDLKWLAEGLAGVLNADGDAQICSLCSEFKDITVETKIGRICEDCIEDITDSAAEIRREMED